MIRVSSKSILLLGLLIMSCAQSLWAAQEAIVVVDKAVIYADENMTGPLGFVRRGKKIKVGEIARNKAQVYPIVVSGRMAYIRVLDVSTEKEAVDADHLIAERFTKATKTKYSTRYTLSYFSFASEISQNEDNGDLNDGDGVPWNGLSLRGEVISESPWALLIIFNYLGAKENREDYRVFEMGAGASYKVIQLGDFSLRGSAQILAVPFSTYAIGSDFRKRGYGVTLGAGLDANYLLTENWGIDIGAGIYNTRLFGFDLPDPYQDIDPSFTGTRLNLGISYIY